MDEDQLFDEDDDFEEDDDDEEEAPEAAFAINGTSNKRHAKKEPAWDIGRLAYWSLSSAKPTNSINELCSNSTDQFWQYFPLAYLTQVRRSPTPPNKHPLS
jgi:hypothetical protein